MHSSPQSTDLASAAEHAEEILESMSAITLLDVLKTGHSSFSILLLTVDGHVLFANEVAVNGFAGETTESITGKSLYSCGPKDWIDERIGFLKKTVEENKPLIIIEAIEGVRLCAHYRAMTTTVRGKEIPVVFLTVEPIIATSFNWLSEHAEKFNVVMADNIDLGELNVLSDREIEVLALMGQGFRQKEIAATLFRSVSTINRHRESIGEKLGITDRAQLIRLANTAALQVDDSARKRAPLNPESEFHQGTLDHQSFANNLYGEISADLNSDSSDDA